MLAPLDGVQVDTLLDQLPERTQLAKERHALLHGLENILDLEVRGESPNAEPNARVRALVTVAQGPQDVAGLQRCGRACTARGEGDVLQSHEKGLALDIGEGNVDTAGIEVVRVTVLASVFQGEEALQQLV